MLCHILCESSMDLQNTDSSQMKSDTMQYRTDYSDSVPVDEKESSSCAKEFATFSGIGEEILSISETANSRACSLKYESDCYNLEAFFTSEDYKNLSAEQILESIIPVIEKYDTNYLWNIFKSIIERRIANLSYERVSDTEWLKEPTIRLAKILFYLPMKKMPSVVLEHLHSDISIEEHQEYLLSAFQNDTPDVLSVKTEESKETNEKYNNGREVIKLLSKINELHHQTVCLSDENSQIQEMLMEVGKKLKITSEENLQLKHQLFRDKVNLKEIDDLTSEVLRLKSKLKSCEYIEKKKQRKLKEIEDEKNILSKRVQEVEGKVHLWHSIMQDAKMELNELRNLVRAQDMKIISSVQEATMNEIQLNDLIQVKVELEKSVKELFEANDALRSDKRILETHLAKMKFLVNKKFGNDCLSSSDILCEDDSLDYQKEIISCVDNVYPSSISSKDWVSAETKSIEVKSGSQLLQKSFAGSEDNIKAYLDEDSSIQKKNSASGKSLICHSSDVRDQINAEIRALREQLVRSQVLFTYLLKDGSTDHTTKSLDCKTQLRTLLEEGNLSDVIFQCKSFDGQVPARFYNRSNRSSSSYASHRSTPMHCGYTSQSCPTLPIESPVVTKSTQTEPMSGVTFYMRTGTNGVYSATSSNSLSKGNVFFSPPSTPCETICEPLVLTDVCEVHREPDDHSFPRHRTNSFLSAVKEGNPKLIDATIEYSDKNTELDGNFIDRKANHVNGFLESNKAEFCDSSLVSKVSEQVVKHNIEDNKECIFPRKLSILLEEDYEDATGNYFSVCSSQPFLNRKKKSSPCYNVKTQTDLSISSQCPNFNSEVSSNKTASDDLPVKEFCLPRQGYSIVTAAVQKKTVYSEKLPNKLVLRHPPPYTKHHSKSSSSMPSGFFQEYHSKSKTHIYKWATVGDSLPSKTESSQNLIPKSRHDTNLQTRHLSLEKQESFSSCDYSLYPESQMSSITDCSAWMTRSDVELNTRPDPPSYQQTVSASHRTQSARNRSENAASEKKPLAEKQSSVQKTSGSVRTENDEKSEGNPEKNFKSQRSMRRGSGAGSPNSQLSIPRYPAFDFGEQEDAQSLFPSPSEPEANHNIKDEILQGMKNSELTSDGDSSQTGSKSLKDISQKKRDSSKSKTLMPELMENSETESAKGSFECEAPDLPLSVDAPPVPVTDIAFPSLPNTFLAKLGVHKDSPLSVEAFDEQELESKFIALSLAFKTDRTTLSKRLELHKRQRDMAEKNVEAEFQAMRDHLNALNLKASRPDVRELISKIQNHLDIAQQATARVSGRSETYGAVQQEERVSRAFEVLVLHVDHLKRLFDKEHKELEETRRMLTDTQAFKREGLENVSEDQKKYLRSFGLPVGSIKSVGRRRASVAEFHQHSSQEIRRSPSFNQSWTSGYGARKMEARQRTLCPFPTASSVGQNSSSLPTSQVTFISPSRVSTASVSARRCSLPAASPLNPNILQNLEAAANNPNLTTQPLPSPDRYKKKEKKMWTRKLSSVSDENELEDEEEGTHDHVNEDRDLLHDPSDIKQLLLVNQARMCSDTYCDQFDADDESHEMSDLDDEKTIPHKSLLQTLQSSSLQDLLSYGLHYVSKLRQEYYIDDIHVIKMWAFYPCLLLICLLLCILFYLLI